jgi:hypothetical protein
MASILQNRLLLKRSATIATIIPLARGCWARLCMLIMMDSRQLITVRTMSSFVWPFPRFFPGDWTEARPFPVMVETGRRQFHFTRTMRRT